MDTFSMLSSPLQVQQSRQKWTVQDRIRHRPAAVSIHPHYGFVCGRHDADWQPRTRSPQDRDLGCLEATGWTQESLAFLNAALQLLRCMSCWNKVVSLPDILHITGSSMTSLWLRKAASKKSVRDIARFSCFVTTMKLLHALQIYTTIFVKKCMRLHF